MASGLIFILKGMPKMYIKVLMLEGPACNNGSRWVPGGLG